MDTNAPISQPRTALTLAPDLRAEPARESDGILIGMSALRSRKRTGRHAWGLDSWSVGPIEVWEALNEDRLVLHYQPQYDMRSGETVAAEALVRLVDTTGELILPGRFIREVENSDLIVPLGRAVISRVCEDLAASRARGVRIERIAINLAARQLNLDTNLLEFIDRELRQHGLSYRDLEFELTERQHLEPGCAGFKTLLELDSLGSRIVLDDFGIGFSSVIHLTDLPIGAFKLDRALVSRVNQDKATATVVRGLLKLASNLNLEVVAEGVETPEQNAFLKRAGCPCAQGFGYARPLPIDALCQFLSNRDEVDGLRISA